MLEVHLEIVGWVYDTFEDNLRIKNHFTKYLKESCLECSYKHIPFKYFPNFAFAWGKKQHKNGILQNMCKMAMQESRTGYS